MYNSVRNIGISIKAFFNTEWWGPFLHPTTEEKKWPVAPNLKKPGKPPDPVSELVPAVLGSHLWQSHTILGGGQGKIWAFWQFCLTTGETLLIKKCSGT